MNLRQFQCFWETYRNNLNTTSAALSLNTSQPNVSKQIRSLESELGVDLFARRGKRIVALTPAGEAILNVVQDLVKKMDTVRGIAEEFHSESTGKLRIATTHTQARYVLPDPIQQFRNSFPDVSLHVNQGTPAQLAELTERGEVDFAIATEGFEHFTDVILLPCYRWNRSVVVPHDHPFAHRMTKISIEELADEDLVTYVFGFAEQSNVSQAFARENLSPNVVFTATDTDVIKKYVQLGLGVGIIASMAYDAVTDNGLVAIDASHLFESNVTQLGFRKGVFLRRYMYEFIRLFAPNLTQRVVSGVLAASTTAEQKSLVQDISVEDYKPAATRN